MKRWLTPEERRTMSPEARRSTRRERIREHRVAKYPPDGIPPWVPVAQEIGRDLLAALGTVAREAVLAAFRAAVGGEARHGYAVEAVLEAARDRAIAVSREEAGAIVYRAYREWEDQGDE